MLSTNVIDSILLPRIDRKQAFTISLRAQLQNINYVLLEQIHSSNVICIDTNDEADGLMKSNEEGELLLHPGDGLISRVPGVYVLVQTADCVPVLLANKQGEFVCALHCGWRGVYQGIIANTYSVLKNFDETIGWIGPCIKQESYVVDAEYRDNFTKLDPEYDRFFINNSENNKYHFDLPGLVEHQLRSYGVRDISISSENTYTSKLYPSYRRSTQENKECFERMICGIGIIER